MAGISLCMIVKNEQDVLARCLDSAKDAVDEIVVVDTGSGDDTKRIAAKYTPHVFDFVWTDDFSAARNEAFNHATQAFMMWLDADDVLDDARALSQFKRSSLEQYDVVMAPYHVAFDAYGHPTFTYYRERILRANMGFRWEGAVHEAIAPKGRVGYADFAVRHDKLRAGDPRRNLRIYEKLLGLGHRFNARERFYYGRELLTAGRLADAAQQLQSVAGDEAAWLENRIEACSGLAECLSRMGDADGSERALLNSLMLDAPRAHIACALGKRLLEKGRLAAARFWYETALNLHTDARSGAFLQQDYTGYIPLLQLCVIYDRLGDREKARACNERAARLRPDDPSVLHNRRYFADPGHPPSLS